MKIGSTSDHGSEFQFVWVVRTHLDLAPLVELLGLSRRVYYESNTITYGARGLYARSIPHVHEIRWTQKGLFDFRDAFAHFDAIKRLGRHDCEQVSSEVSCVERAS